MKNWLTIGQFSKKIGVSPKALRLYEKIGLIISHTRGENGYRYYDDSQIPLGLRIKEFKRLGFSLTEIKGLLQTDCSLGSENIAEAMKARLSLIADHFDQLNQQKGQIEEILISLKSQREPLEPTQRRAIMSFYGKVSVVVTGCGGLEKTAKLIQRHFQSAKVDIPVIHWNNKNPVNLEKPYILVIKESELASNEVDEIHPDVIVIKSLGSHSGETQQNYLRLYSEVGPHVSTILNADDRSSVDLATQSQLRKGRIFYFSKNEGLEPQIKRIGGVISNGENVEIYGFNLKPEVINLKLEKILTLEDETALLSSLGAVMTVGLEKENLHTT